MDETDRLRGFGCCCRELVGEVRDDVLGAAVEAGREKVEQARQSVEIAIEADDTTDTNA